jgi:hypothetical protein
MRDTPAARRLLGPLPESDAIIHYARKHATPPLVYRRECGVHDERKTFVLVLISQCAPLCSKQPLESLKLSKGGYYKLV